MKSFELSADLPAPPEVSWAFVIDRGSEIEPLTFEPRGAQGVGTLNDLSGRLLGIPIRGVSTTTAWNPPLECAFASVKPSWPVRTHITETFNSSGTGTRHVIRYEVIGRGVVGSLAAPLFCALMRRSRKTYQARLAVALGDAAASS